MVLFIRSSSLDNILISWCGDEITPRLNSYTNPNSFKELNLSAEIVILLMGILL